MHGVYQCRHMFGWRELTDAMSKVKDMSWPVGAGIGVGCPKAVEHPSGFGAQRFRWCEQAVGVEVALQSFACAAH